jgi:hypothetical protein
MVLHILYTSPPFVIGNHELSPGQAENFSTMSGDTNLGLSIGTLDTCRDLFALPLQDYFLARSFGQLIKAASVTAKEVLELLLCDLIFRNGATLDSLLKTKKNKLHHIRLGEHTSRRLTLFCGGLGLQRMRGTIASTMACQYHRLWWYSDEEVSTTYKKNLELPLTTALTRASLSVGFLGIGLQKAKGSQQASLEVR